MENRIDLKPEYQKMVIDLCKKAFENCCHVEIILFGSRGIGTARRSSDIDLAVKTDQEVSVQIGKLREYLEESTIPYTVDIVLLNEAEGNLKKEIEEKGVVLWKN